MLQDFLVAAIVVIAVAYAAWALLPGSTRLRLAGRLRAWGLEPGRQKWLESATAAIERAADRRHGGCNGCSPGRPEMPPRGEHRGR